MSSFDIAAVTAELNSILNGFRIDNIYQLNPKTMLLKLRGQEGSRRNLVLEAGKRVHTTTYAIEKPMKPPAFCMALRKYLRNGRIEKVQQYGFERIVEISTASKSRLCRLAVELFGEGNIVLVNQDNKVLQALSYRRMKDRNILRGEAFVYPPSRGKDPISLQREDLYEIRSFGQLEAVKAVARFLGVGGPYTEEILLRAGIAKNTLCSILGDEELDAIFRSLMELLSEVKIENEKPCVFVDDEGNWVDVAPTDLKKYGHLRRIGFQTFNEALDEYFAKVTVIEKVSDVEELVEREMARLERIALDQEETLRESKMKADAYRRWGDAIYQHLNELQMLIERVMTEKRSGKSWKEMEETLEMEKGDSLVPALYFEALKPETLSVQVSVEGEAFGLDLRLSAQKNAADYYVRAKKAERKIEGVEKSIEQTRQKIEKTRLRAVEAVETTSKPLPKKRKEEWYEKFRWFHSSDSLLVIGGRDASTNEILLKRYMEPQDLVFHADIFGAPFVLVKTEGRKPSEQTIKEAAQFAVTYSRAWKEGLRAADAYWVSPQQVSKTPPSGEYLPKGAFMIYGTKNYLKGLPLEVAVGLKREDDQLRAVGGPPDAIAKQTDLYVRLVQGPQSSGNLAKQIRGRLAWLTSDEEQKEVLKTPLEEIQRFIPAGRGAVK